MSTPLQEEIDALRAKIDEYESLPLADRLIPSTAALITAKQKTLNRLLEAQAAATEARGKHLSPSL